MAAVTLLLPGRARFGAQRLSPALGASLARADCRRVDGDQLGRVFDVLPRGWPVAAVTRQRDAGDAGNAVWLRADPAYIRPDINGARLLAHGEALALTTEDVAALLPSLRPLFGDAGWLLDAPQPSRWYLQLPAGARLPAFVTPDDALGADLFDQLPGSGSNPEGDGRRWRALLSETQVLLHNNPRNAERIGAGLAPVNSLWFWGAGALPDHVRTRYTHVQSGDEALDAFARLANVTSAPLPARWQGTDGEQLVDLRHARDLTPLQADWLAPLMDDLGTRRLDRVILDFADGSHYTLTTRQRWRFWRKPLRSLLA